ncbi:ribosome recycling factor [Candidatus Deianiraea vastatrix]|uniref:Ribosome-recycling factor n=1 Tax=Candidatus Deianiraea vastatrix TaxID=2163644 RepID=A0A5B8XCP7_9RICK|nr:ribosome recycling factor [Candidatus Deianiraea vastatrix]QED23073.1 Ribosome-recycling factor [Candidatus Deianiraea vastatrix]
MYNFNKKEVENRMQKALDAFENHLGSVRSGRASPAFLESVLVEIYGQKMRLKEVASISVVDNFTLSVKPFDSSSASVINKEIQDAGLGVNPILESGIIRVPLPKMTEDRRKEMVKICEKYAEDSKIAIRNIRRDENDKTKKAEKDKEISKDEMERNEADVQKITDMFIKKIEDSLDRKSKEILHI